MLPISCGSAAACRWSASREVSRCVGDCWLDDARSYPKGVHPRYRIRTANKPSLRECPPCDDVKMIWATLEDDPWREMHVHELMCIDVLCVAG